jgi:hypothetical protein
MAYAKSRSLTASRAYGPGFTETKALTTKKQDDASLAPAEDPCWNHFDFLPTPFRPVLAISYNLVQDVVEISRAVRHREHSSLGERSTPI